MLEVASEVAARSRYRKRGNRREGHMVTDTSKAGALADKDKFSPIFADSEWDSYPTCDVCREAITEVRLTEEGRRYHNKEG